MSGYEVVEILCFWIYNNKIDDKRYFFYVRFPLYHYLGLFQATYLARLCLPFKMDDRNIDSYYFSKTMLRVWKLQYEEDALYFEKFQ